MTRPRARQDALAARAAALDAAGAHYALAYLAFGSEADMATLERALAAADHYAAELAAARERLAAETRAGPDTTAAPAQEAAAQTPAARRRSTPSTVDARRRQARGGAVTNYGALAILAELHEGAPARQVRLLVALETFPADAEGWRTVSTGTLCLAARLSRNPLRQAARELAAAKLIEHEPGVRSGTRSRWRFTFPLDDPPPKSGGTQGHPRAGGTQGHPSQERARGGLAASIWGDSRP